jgi:fructose-1-phosphate kinase PfkB-like protein
MKLGRPFSEGLVLGTAAGAATAATPGTQLCSASEVEALLSQCAVTLFEAAA